MSLLTVLILLVLLYIVPELFRPKNQKYEYPDIPDANPVPTMQQYDYAGEGISAERRYDSSEGISAMRPQKPNQPKVAMPMEVHVPEHTEAENPWVGRLDLPHVVNGLVFAEILRRPGQDAHWRIGEKEYNKKAVALHKVTAFISGMDYQKYIGKTGKALTLLRPAGTVEFDGDRLDVVSEGLFIEPGTKVVVVKVEESRIVVRIRENKEV